MKIRCYIRQANDSTLLLFCILSMLLACLFFDMYSNMFMLIDKLKDYYGNKKGTQSQVWVDQVFPSFPSQIDSYTWLVKFKK